jgi:hypothetical protein
MTNESAPHRIAIIAGDITQQRVDAIVNTAGTIPNFWCGSTPRLADPMRRPAALRE